MPRTNEWVGLLHNDVDYCNQEKYNEMVKMI